MKYVPPGPVLVIEGDESQTRRLSEWLRKDGHTVHMAADADGGLVLARQLEPSLVLGELNQPTATSMSLLRALLDDLPETSLIVVAESATLDQAVSALQEGACDFLVKSMLNEDILHLSVQRALERRSLRLENQHYRAALEDSNARLQKSLQLLEYDQRAGRQVQSKLLPPTPHETNGLTLSHVILPSLYLSGDFVDYFSLGPGRTAFYLADVSGHGASSAFVTVFLKTLTNRIRRHFEKRTKVSLLSPAKLMHAMNEELRALETGKHLTVFCGVIDTTNNTLTYALAAHYPPAFLCQHGEVMPLVGSGLPLGLFADAQFEEHEIALAPQFSIIALSDGILEIMPTGDLPSKEALLQAHVAAATHDFEALNMRLGLPSAKDLPDDIALLMITRDE